MSQTDVMVAAAAPTGAGSRRRRARPLAALPYVVVAIYLVAAAIGPVLVPYDPVATEVTERLLPPGSATASGTAWLGTDAVGRDVFAQIVAGTRTSFVIGISVVGICGIVGVTLGAVAGYFRRLPDAVVSRAIDILMAFPGILLAILIAGLLDRGMDVVILALSVGGWVGFARLSRSISMSTRERDWVAAARIMGVSTTATLTRHIAPFLAGSVIALATIELAGAILSEAALSFLGLGLPPDVVSWGQTIANGREYLGTAWWITVFPGIALTVLVVCIGLIGDRLTKRYTRKRD
ncbi:binding-protein-dependent transport systems inner membrane component [Beutenbergia cavernae DSM 12333]|uniref:Binding-protein-dependent transport systems inner membrane component n=1 Tax=Beutenbergia cavernae (strain ATCC BAA-8 / DSM 12333 / CCUG 43141 / JCM 11478 / NBRC 16432 / NCIMB 13614 / HKI 0122) TaxID=471853 RepID=C5C267_BEUC1|nr:ABC transporter permease [Beutenbergia cavernae]ACQ81692.1 binding-protein-dependent transport systems inner membrane component [Beutenbergia cavernae DSM 12333]